jgi:acyl-CoA dehydrogenase
VGFTLSDEQLALIESARTVARTSLVSVAESGAPGRVNRELVKALGSTGMLAMIFPSGGPSAMELCLLREGLAIECTEAETALALQGLGAYPIARSGTPEQVEQWVAPVARGESVAAFALSEPGAGSDAAALSLRAEPDGDAWRLTGTKKWISNAPDADVYVVFARTDAAVSAFIVAGDAPGLTGRPLEMVAPHALGELSFDGVRGELLGEDGGGLRVAMATLDLFRPSVGAFAVGMARAALDAAVAHAASREAFGRRLREFQAVSHVLAEMATRTDAARLLVYRAASAYDDGAAGVTKTSAMAKLYATETAQYVIDAAIQIHGAAALEQGHLLEKLYRDVRATRIYEGTSEIQREIIARELYR